MNRDLDTCIDSRCVCSFCLDLVEKKQQIMAGFTVRDERTVRIEGKAARLTVIASGLSEGWG